MKKEMEEQSAPLINFKLAIVAYVFRYANQQFSDLMQIIWITRQIIWTKKVEIGWNACLSYWSNYGATLDRKRERRLNSYPFHSHPLSSQHYITASINRSFNSIVVKRIEEEELKEEEEESDGRRKGYSVAAKEVTSRGLLRCRNINKSTQKIWRIEIVISKIQFW